MSTVSCKAKFVSGGISLYGEQNPNNIKHIAICLSNQEPRILWRFNKKTKEKKTKYIYESETKKLFKIKTKNRYSHLIETPSVNVKENAIEDEKKKCVKKQTRTHTQEEIS